MRSPCHLPFILLALSGSQCSVQTAPETVPKSNVAKNQLTPVRKFADANCSRFEGFFRPQGARVAWVDYELLRQDFPTTMSRIAGSGTDLDDESRNRIDEWLLERFARISERQMSVQQEFNSTIKVVAMPELPYTNNESADLEINQSVTHQAPEMNRLPQTMTIHGYSKKLHPKIDGIKHTVELHPGCRPPDYGRAALFATWKNSNPEGIIDAKGTGAGKDAELAHQHGDGFGNGLASLGECLREVVWQRAVQAAADREKRLAASSTCNVNAGGVDTIRNYAVIYLGFDVKHEDRTTDPAGVVLRQAHRRSPYRRDLPADTTRLFIRYRINNAPRILLWHHLQRSIDDRLVDFGAYIAHPTVLSDYDLDRIRRLLERNETFNTDADPLRFPSDHWESPRGDPRSDLPWQWAHNTAKAFVDQNFDRNIVQRFVDEMDHSITGRPGW